MGSKQVIVLKIGSNSITKGCNEGINLEVINKLATSAARIIKEGNKVIIVSSGAMALGVAKLGKNYIQEKTQSNPCAENITSYKQAITSIGQVELMKAYENVFKFHGLHAGQVLVTHAGLDDTDRNSTIKTTLERMLEIDLVPIINANDTVTSKELEYGDNDSLSARISALISASKLVIFSDVDGLYDKDPNKFSDAKLIRKVESINSDIKSGAGESSSGIGLGGMKSKIDAVDICLRAGIAAYILNASQIEKTPEIISGALNDFIGTEFVSSLKMV
jgi:glutamate 5-kinase